MITPVLNSPKNTNQEQQIEQTPPAQDLREQERIAKLDEQREKNNPANANRQIPLVIRSILESKTDKDFSFGAYLEGNSNPEAERLRSDLFKYLASNTKESKIMTELLASLVGIDTPAANSIRWGMFQEPLNSILEKSIGPNFLDFNPYKLERVLGSYMYTGSIQGEAALRQFITLPYRNGISIWQALTTHQEAIENDEQFAGEVQMAKELLIMAVQGNDSTFAWQIRNALPLKSDTFIISSISGLNHSRAWEIRNNELKEETESWQRLQSNPEFNETASFNDNMTRVIQGLQGIETPQAIKYRLDAMQNAGASPIDVLTSLNGVKTPKAIALREEMLGLINADLAKFTIPDVINAIMGDNSEIAWKIREQYYKDAQKIGQSIPLAQYYDLAESEDLTIKSALYSIGNINDARANKFIEQAIKDKKITSSDLLKVLRGSELPIIWEERDKFFNELKETDRLKQKTSIEFLETLPASERQRIIGDLRFLWKKNGLHHMENLTDDKAIEHLKKIQKESKGDSGPDSIKGPYFYVINSYEEGSYYSSTHHAWTEVLTRHNQSIEHIRSLSVALSGMTSTRAGDMRQTLKKEGVGTLELLDACRGVFTAEANTIRNQALKELHELANEGNYQKESLKRAILRSLSTDSNLLDSLTGDRLNETFKFFHKSGSSISNSWGSGEWRDTVMGE